MSKKIDGLFDHGALDGSEPLYDEESEALLERSELLSIEIGCLHARSKIFSFTPLNFPAPLESADKLFKQKLVRFARQRKISLARPDWQMVALKEAAYDHKELNPKNKPRGRPPKKNSIWGGIFGVKESFPELEQIEKIQDIVLRNHNKKISSANAIRFWLQIMRDQAGLDYYEKWSEDFHTKVRSFENKVSKQRRERRNAKIITNK